MKSSSKFTVGFLTIVLATSHFPGLPCLSQEPEESPPKDWLELMFAEDKSAIKHTFIGELIRDLSAIKLIESEFNKLDKQTETEEGLAKVIERLKNGKDAVGIAVFLNQKYKEKLFDPVAWHFTPEYPGKIPIYIMSNEQKVGFHVTPETFGKICYSYWSLNLNVGDLRLPDIILKQREELKNKAKKEAGKSKADIQKKTPKAKAKDNTNPGTGQSR